MAFSPEKDISKIATWAKVIPTSQAALKATLTPEQWLAAQLQIRSEYGVEVNKRSAQRAAPSGSALLSQGALFKSLLTTSERRAYLKHIKDRAYWGDRYVDFVTAMEGNAAARKLQEHAAFQGGALKSWERHSLAVMDEVDNL